MYALKMRVDGLHCLGVTEAFLAVQVTNTGGGVHRNPVATKIIL